MGRPRHSGGPAAAIGGGREAGRRQIEGAIGRIERAGPGAVFGLNLLDDLGRARTIKRDHVKYSVAAARDKRGPARLVEDHAVGTAPDVEKCRFPAGMRIDDWRKR